MILTILGCFPGSNSARFGLILGRNRAESGRCTGTDFQRRESTAVKECSDRESEIISRKATVLEIMKIVFKFFRPPGIGSDRSWEVCMCI